MKKKIKDFDSWWEISKSQNKINKFRLKWLKENPPNPEDEDCGGDFWHVNQMVHEGEADDMCYENAREVFERTLEEGEEGKPTQCDSLYCDLDDIIWDGYNAALKIYQEKNKN